MFQLWKVYKAPISIHIKIYSWSFVDYQHLRKYSYNWNITLNYCFIHEINIKVNLTGYAPGIESTAHISTPLFCRLRKIVNDPKGYVPAVTLIMSFKVLEYFSSGKISCFYLLAHGKEISNRKNWSIKFFLRNRSPTHIVGKKYRNIGGNLFQI